MKFGIIGTSLISKQFSTALNSIEGFSAAGIYSRDYQKGKLFAEENKVSKVYTSLDEMAKDSNIDAIYIASPNSLHSENSIFFLTHKKPVLCEKPLAGTYEDCLKMVNTARQNNTLLMEAMKTPLMPNMEIIKKNIEKVGKVRKFTGVFCQYSSKYPQLLAGELPNIFNPKMQTGCAMDIAVYPLTFALHLFGVPSSISASATLLNGNIDGACNIILKYKDMEAVIIASKISNSFISSEIQGENGAIVIDKISHIEGVKYIDRNGSQINISENQDSTGHFMKYEIKHFAKLIQEGKVESSINTHAMSLSVIKVLDEVRDQIGIKYKNF